LRRLTGPLLAPLLGDADAISMRSALLQRSRELMKPALPSLALPRSSLPDLFLTGNRSHDVSSSEVVPYRIRERRANPRRVFAGRP
jgi:hypothetical protein